MAISTDASPAELGNTAGGWNSARLIIFVEMAERFAYFGVSSNLITYLTGPLGQPTAAAAANVNVWIGTMAFLPLLWGFVADGCLGRYRTIILSSSLYILGLGTLSFSAIVPSHSEDSNQLKVTIFFCSLCLVAIGQSGYKPCAKVFGADQFDGNDLKERKAKSSYFNWLMFGSCVSITITRLVSSYIQENLSWSLGFGIQCVSMLLALFLFLFGTKTYRFSTARGGKNNPFARIGRVFMEAVKNRRRQDCDIANPNETSLLLRHQSSENFRLATKVGASPKKAVSNFSLIKSKKMSNPQDFTSPSSKPKFFWTHEMSHEMLVLANDEKDKGYWKGTCFNEMGRQNIRAGFLTRFGLNLHWAKFKSRLEHLRKQYDIYKRVTKNATGLGFTQFGEIDMSTDWWDQLIKMHPEATKLRVHPLRDITLLDSLYQKVTIFVSEGWQHQNGPSQLPQQIESEDEEVDEISSPVNNADSQKTHRTQGSRRVHEEKPARSKSSRKRPNSDHWDRITSTLENQERFWSAGRKTFDSFNPFNTAICTEELLKMSMVDQESEFYWAALDYLASNENGRQIFMTLPNEQQKIKYLERAIGKQD